MYGVFSNKNISNANVTSNKNVSLNKNIYHIIYKSSNRNKVHDKFGIMYFEKLITMQIRSRD